MKIAVCVKEVPEAGSPRRIDPQSKRLDRSGEGALNAFDVNAVEEALRLREAAGESEVVVLSLGPERALEPMRKALWHAPAGILSFGRRWMPDEDSNLD